MQLEVLTRCCQFPVAIAVNKETSGRQRTDITEASRQESSGDRKQWAMFGIDLQRKPCVKTVPKHEGPLLSGSKHPSGSGDQWADQSQEPGQLDTGYTGYILYGTRRLRTCDMALSMAEGLVDCFHARVGELLMASWLGGKKEGSPEPHQKTAMMV